MFVGSGADVAVGGTGVAVLVGVGGTGVRVAALTRGAGVTVGTFVGGTGVGVRVWNGSAVGSSSEEHALKPIVATTTKAVNTVTAMNRTPTRDNRVDKVPNDFNAVLKT